MTRSSAERWPRARGWMHSALRPPAAPVARVDDPAERRAIGIELAVVGVLTFGFSAVRAALSLIEMALTSGVATTTVALNPARSSVAAIDVIRQVMSAATLASFAALVAYLLWRSGIRLTRIGLTRPDRRDVPPGLLLAAVIGLPGLGLVAVARALGVNADLAVAPGDGLWWRIPLLVVTALANGLAEEIVVVGYFITRLRQLGAGPTSALASSALLRGGYHLYQGVGGGVGNLLMGLVYGRWYQMTNRLWPLVLGHALIDVVAFVGYAVLTRLGVDVFA